jgi:hypothetical protein
MRFRKENEAGFAAVEPTARIAAGLLAIALVVVFNQTSRPTTVLGAKIERCDVGGAPVTVGSRTLAAQAVSATVRKGKVAALLIEPEKITPRGVPLLRPLTFALGLRVTKPGTIDVTVLAENLSSCSIALDPVRVNLQRGDDPIVGKIVRLGGADRTVLAPGKRVRARVLLPLAGDGPVSVRAVGSADVGASA